MTLRVLLVESEPEDVLFLQDVLTDIEAGRYWTNWVHIETLHAASFDEAAAVLANESIDVILLNPGIEDGVPALATFQRIQAAAHRVPIVLLINPGDDALALRMIREGAQDFLIRKQTDCAPLSHAIRNAVERHRLLSALQACSITDSLTGLPNRGAFLTAADRDRKLAERLGRRLMIVIAEPSNLAGMASAFGEQRRDLALVEAADYLRSLTAPTDLVARIEDTRFGIAVFETAIEPLEDSWARLHSLAAERRIRTGAAIFDQEHAFSLDVLLERAAADLTPQAMATVR